MGRDTELATLATACATALDRAVLLVIEGDAGFGKSALVERILASEKAFSCQVHLATADPLETDRPFGPVLDALDLRKTFALSDVSVGKDPDASVGLFGLAADARYRLIDLVCSHVEAEAAKGPIALIIEDLHYCDASTLLVLRALRKRLASHALLIVGTTRPVTADPEAQRVLEHLRSEADCHIGLGPLDDCAVEQLAERVWAGSVLGPRLRERIRSAEGAPFLLCELLDDLSTSESLDRVSGVVELASPTLPAAGSGLRASTERRLRKLTVAGKQLIGAGSVLGTTFDLELAFQLASVSSLDTSQTVRELATAGFLTGTSNPAKFRHDLVRESVAGLLPPAERSRLHYAVANAYAARGAAPAVVAAHFEASGCATPIEIRSWLLRAASEASVRSPATAHRLYSRALELTAHDDPQWSELALEQLGNAASAGLCDEAERHGRVLLAADLQPIVRLRVLWWLAGVQFLRNRLKEAAGLYTEAADGLQKDRDGVRCLAMAAMCHVLAFDGEIQQAVERAMELAGVSDDPVARTVSHMAMARWVGYRGEYQRGIDLSSRAIEFADADPSGEAHRYQPHVVHAIALLDVGDFDALMATVDRGRRRCVETGTGWAEALYHGLAAIAQFYAGRLEEALTEAEAGLAVADDAGVRLMATWCLAVQGLVHQLQGDDEEGEAAISAARAELAQDAGQVGFDLVALYDARRKAASGNVTEACDELQGILEFAAGIGIAATGFCALPDLVIEAIGTGNAVGVSAAVSFAQSARHTNALDLFEWALLAVDAEKGSASDESSRRTASDRFALRRPIDAARLDLARARVLLASGQRTAAERLVRRAERALSGHGAYSHLRTARAAFPGIDRRGRPARRVTSGWRSLTPTEVFVVELLAKGASNRAIAENCSVSTRTAETHVSRILRKLEVTSRLQVVALVRDRS